VCALFVWSFALISAEFVALVVHELGHACAALRRTDAPVLVLIGTPLTVLRFGRLSVGLGMGFTGAACGFAAPESPRAQAAIAAAGPAASMLVAIAAATAFATIAGASFEPPLGPFCVALAVAGLLGAIRNGVPRANARGLYGAGGNDGHQVAVILGWRAPAAAPPPGVTRPASVAPPSARALAPGSGPAEAPRLMGTWAKVVLALVFVFALFAAPGAALAMVVLFGLAALASREQDHAKRLRQARAPQRRDR